MPTRVYTAGRHMTIGPITKINLVSSFAGFLVSVALAALTESIWSLVAGALTPSIVKLALANRYLAGHRNRFYWRSDYGRELFRFGRWIFISTICTFLATQGDKAILGAHLSIGEFGLYAIAAVFATAPMVVASNLAHRLFLPVYRERPPTANRENFRNTQKMRFLFSGGVLTLLFMVAVAGPFIVDTIYDDRYTAVGALIVIMACAEMPAVLALSYHLSAVAAGDSRTSCANTLLLAAAQLSGLIIGLSLGGLYGAIFGVGVARVIAHPLQVLISYRYSGYAVAHDLYMGALGAAFIAVALAAHGSLLGF